MKDSQTESKKEIIVLCVAILGVALVFSQSLIRSTSHRTIFTIEVYDIFEVVHVENEKGHWTCVYTNGTGQYFFRGDLDIDETKAYSFTYRETGKRWRDLIISDYHEIRVLVRGID